MAAGRSVLPPQGDHKENHSHRKICFHSLSQLCLHIIAHQVTAQLAQWVAYDFCAGA